MKLTGKRCLITGGAGFIGSHLVDELIRKGCTVRVLDNLANGKLENLSNHLGQENFQFFRGSITDPLDVQSNGRNRRSFSSRMTRQWWSSN